MIIAYFDKFIIIQIKYIMIHITTNDTILRNYMLYSKQV